MRLHAVVTSIDLAVGGMLFLQDKKFAGLKRNKCSGASLELTLSSHEIAGYPPV